MDREWMPGLAPVPGLAVAVPAAGALEAMTGEAAIPKEVLAKAPPVLGSHMPVAPALATVAAAIVLAVAAPPPAPAATAAEPAAVVMVAEKMARMQTRATQTRGSVAAAEFRMKMVKSFHPLDSS